MRRSWVEIDLGAIRSNVETLVRLVAPAEVCAVVKADGYGHGDVPAGEAALDGGAKWLAVALLEEGIRLREAGIEAPVLVLSEPNPADAAELLRWRLTPAVYTEGFLEALSSGAQSKAGVHLKVDTGMHRVGAPESKVANLVDRISADPRLFLEGAFTHFAVSEEDPGFTEEQANRFDKALTSWDVPIVHMANTAGAILHPNSRRDLVRTGIGIYGLHPSQSTRARVDLKPAMRIVSHVGYMQRLPAGARPSYGRRRALAEESWVATVPIGYADGVPRLLSENGEVLVAGVRRPLAGTVTMDQIVVDCGNDQVEVGEEVVLIGRQGVEEILADEWARELGTINYEIVCQVGPRLPRRYLQ